MPVGVTTNEHTALITEIKRLPQDTLTVTLCTELPSKILETYFCNTGQLTSLAPYIPRSILQAEKMSVNITVAVPIEAIIAIQDLEDFHGHRSTNSAITTQTTRALIDAIKALPYQLVPKAGQPGPQTIQPVVARTRGTAGGRPMNPIKFIVQTLTGKIIHLATQRTSTMYEVASAIQDREGIPPDQQRLVYNGQTIFDMDDDADADGDDLMGQRTLEEVRLPQHRS